MKCLEYCLPYNNIYVLRIILMGWLSLMSDEPWWYIFERYSSAGCKPHVRRLDVGG